MSLDPKTEHAVCFFAAAVKSVDAVGTTTQSLAAKGADPGMLFELALQVPLFAGYPRAINALKALRAAFPDFVTQSSDPVDGAALEGRGEALFRRIYGERSDTVVEHLANLHGELPALILEAAYARVLSRPGVDTLTRELCSVAALMVSGDERQWASHISGALHCGADAATLRATMALAASMTTPDVLARAEAMLDRIASSAH